MCAHNLQAPGKRGVSHPKMSWKELTKRDCREWKLSNSSPHDRKKWRHGVKSAMHAASQSPGREPTSVDNASELAH